MHLDIEYVWLFVAGALFCNSIPHLCSGLQGRPFPTPSARPRGVGDSSPIVNFVWGFVNFVVALVIATRHWHAPGMASDAIAALVGALGTGLSLAFHFGKVQRAKQAR
jgi:hypothetical protein